MKRFLVIGGPSTVELSRASLPALADYVRELAPEGAEVLATHCDQLVYSLRQGSFECLDTTHNFDVSQADYVIMRGPSVQVYYLSRFCAARHVPLMNDFSLYYNGTKVAQTIQFYEEDVPFLPTLYTAHLKLLTEQAEKTFNYPYILKSATGSHGDSNYLVRSREQAHELIAKEPDVPFIAQEYCPNDRDYRLLVAGDGHMVIERHGNGDSHLNNTSKGAAATLANDVLPEAIFDGAHRIARRLGLTVAGIDVMPNRETGAFYFLEVNSQPQLRTGALLDGKRELIARLLQHPTAGRDMASNS